MVAECRGPGLQLPYITSVADNYIRFLLGLSYLLASWTFNHNQKGDITNSSYLPTPLEYKQLETVHRNQGTHPLCWSRNLCPGAHPGAHGLKTSRGFCATRRLPSSSNSLGAAARHEAGSQSVAGVTGTTRFLEIIHLKLCIKCYPEERSATPITITSRPPLGPSVEIQHDLGRQAKVEKPRNLFLSHCRIETALHYVLSQRQISHGSLIQTNL